MNSSNCGCTKLKSQKQMLADLSAPRYTAPTQIASGGGLESVIKCASKLLSCMIAALRVCMISSYKACCCNNKCSIPLICDDHIPDLQRASKRDIFAYTSAKLYQFIKMSGSTHSSSQWASLRANQLSVHIYSTHSFCSSCVVHKSYRGTKGYIKQCSLSRSLARRLDA